MDHDLKNTTRALAPPPTTTTTTTLTTTSLTAHSPFAPRTTGLFLSFFLTPVCSRSAGADRLSRPLGFTGPPGDRIGTQVEVTGAL
ncbi:hypothetical protein EYF80_051611 [Liparis tanakae]|uniref:Uncharacterized protein n=1 Tax=Liparis tanakae TaxID=230148 RepID=A0A4Z2FAL2_9TELE|nr:hypothetical protein EYF80_051611 [Liparis tanakae]